MSHRITFRSEIKELDLAKAALDDTKMGYRHDGDFLRITSGPLARAVINLKTGVIESDSDFHSKEQLGMLRQAYSEAEFRRVANRQGATIEGRSVRADGVVELKCRMTA